MSGFCTEFKVVNKETGQEAVTTKTDFQDGMERLFEKLGFELCVDGKPQDWCKPWDD